MIYHISYKSYPVDILYQYTKRYKAMGNQKSLLQTNFISNFFKTKSGNIIWAAGMQLAWNELSDKFASNQPIKLLTNQPNALQIINNFNQKLFTTKDIDENCIYVKSGYGQTTVDTINHEVKTKFPKKTIPPLDDKLDDTDIISYAYLLKQIEFEVQFQARKELEFKFNGKAVKSFHGKNLQQKKQVLVHSYVDESEFMVEINGKGNKDSLFLIKSKKIQSIEEAIKATINVGKEPPQPLRKDDIFQMPVINFDVNRQYKELIGLPFANEELQQYVICEMREIIKLSIDQKGAKVENQAKIIATRCREIPHEPKFIVLNENFWIVMKEIGKKPYLCVFVNTPQDLQ